MTSTKKINRRITKYQESIEFFRSQKDLDPERKRRAIFTLQGKIRDLKWVLTFIE